MSRRWEKGVVVGKTLDNRTVFIASSYDTVVLYGSSVYDLGDCVEFTSSPYFSSQKVICQRKVNGIKKIPSFLEYELEKKKNSALLVLNVTDVKQTYDPKYNQSVRVFKTDFLEEVFDSRSHPITDKFTLNELYNSKIVCKRVVDHILNVETWVVSNIKKGCGIKNNQMESVRQKEKGFVFGSGCTKQGKDELYIWIPNVPKDIFFPLSLRENADRTIFIGKWLSFSLNANNEMDCYSNVKIIDDVIPTRQYNGKYEVKVDVYHDFESNINKPFTIFGSKMCESIIDRNNVIEKYNRNYTFSAKAWAYCQLDPQTRIRFVLSNLQEEWNSPKTSDNFYSSETRSQREKSERGSSCSDYDGSSSSFQNRRNIYQNQINERFESDSDYGNEPLKMSKPRCFDEKNSESDRRSKKSEIDEEARSENKIEENPFKTDLDCMKHHYEYCNKNNLSLSDDFLKKLTELLAEEKLNQKMKKQKQEENKFENRTKLETESANSSIIKRDRVKIEILEEKMSRYKKIIDIVKDMISCKQVSDAMKDYDEEASEELIERIINL